MSLSETQVPTELSEQDGSFRLGKAKGVKGSMKTLLAGDYIKKGVAAPDKFDFWSKRSPFPLFDTGNNEYGNCTIASQSLAMQRLERLESRKTVAFSKDGADGLVNTYLDMSERVYGHRTDEGAYELDALNNWRNQGFTFADAQGTRKYTIDGFTKINHSNIQEVKNALYVSPSKVIKVCFALPWAWAGVRDCVWDIPEGQQPIGDWQPYSWGGHSMMAIAKWDKDWLWLPSSWNMPDGKISWRAFAMYCDEAYMIVDSVDYWKKQTTKKEFDLSGFVSDVNSVSSNKIGK